MSTAVSSWPAVARNRHPRDSSRHAITSRESYKTSLLSTASATWNCEQPADLRALIKARASAHQRDARGNTCLHHILGAAHPSQPWVILSLTILLRAGADPHQANNYGSTAFDIACDAPAALGSFRRDLLLQALLESEMDIQDSRLLTPTRLTSTYTDMRHAVLFGHQFSHSEYEIRTALLERLTEATQQRNLMPDRRLLEAALKRVMRSYALAAFTDSESIFNDTLRYLELMCEGKTEIIRLCRIRLRKEVWSVTGRNLNLLGMAQQAHTTALLEFDWFRPVDVEDLFSSYADVMIEQLEALSPAERERGNVAECIDLLQNAIPSYRALSIRETKSAVAQSQARPDSAKGLPNSETSGAEGNVDSLWPIEDGVHGEERERKVSIATTPAEYYGPKFWSH